VIGEDFRAGLADEPGAENEHQRRRQCHPLGHWMEQEAGDSGLDRGVPFQVRAAACDNAHGVLRRVA